MVRLTLNRPLVRGASHAWGVPVPSPPLPPFSYFLGPNCLSTVVSSSMSAVPTTSVRRKKYFAVGTIWGWPQEPQRYVHAEVAGAFYLCLKRVWWNTPALFGAAVTLVGHGQGVAVDRFFLFGLGVVRRPRPSVVLDTTAVRQAAEIVNRSPW